MNVRLQRWIPAAVAVLGAAFALGTLAMTQWVEGVGTGQGKGLRNTLRKYDPLQRIELITYDWRARRAADREIVVSPKLGLIALDDLSIAELQDGEILGVHVGPLWPRYVYGLVLRELRAQGAEGVAGVGLEIDAVQSANGAIGFGQGVDGECRLGVHGCLVSQ